MSLAGVEVHALKCQFFGHSCSCRLLAFANTLEITAGRETHIEIMRVLSLLHVESRNNAAINFKSYLKGAFQWG
jgi:hypothetical protein